jgi:hypothetical protein
MDFNHSNHLEHCFIPQSRNLFLLFMVGKILVISFQQISISINIELKYKP